MLREAQSAAALVARRAFATLRSAKFRRCLRRCDYFRASCMGWHRKCGHIIGAHAIRHGARCQNPLFAGNVAASCQAAPVSPLIIKNQTRPKRLNSMEFFRIQKDIPFMRHALVFNVISFATFALAVFFLFTRGLHLSVEFTGGTVMEVAYSESADIAKVRETVAALGYSDVTVQNFGTSRDVRERAGSGR